MERIKKIPAVVTIMLVGALVSTVAIVFFPLSAWSAKLECGGTSTPRYCLAIEVTPGDNEAGDKNNPDCKKGEDTSWFFGSTTYHGASCVTIQIDVPARAEVVHTEMYYKEYGQNGWTKCQVATKGVSGTCPLQAIFRNYSEYTDNAGIKHISVEFANWASSKRDAQVSVWYNNPPN
jgi:hypothetical protein